MRFQLTLILLIFATTTFSQTKIELYKTQSGQIFTQKQFDSILNSGRKSIAKIEKIESKDTLFTIIKVEVLKPQQSEFAIKYENKKLPIVKLTDINGKTLKFHKLKGKVLLINFWSIYCGPCVEEIPHLNILKEKYKKQVVFIGIAPEEKEKVNQFLKKYPYNFIIISDAKKLFDELQIDGYPKNFFVDKNGIVRTVYEGTPISRNPETNKWEISVVDRFSKIIDAIIKND